MARKRNPNGAGTITKRKDGRHMGRAYVTTPDGTRERLTVYGKTWEEAHDKLLKALSQEKSGIPQTVKSWKLGDWLDHWLEHVVKVSKRPSTYVLYELMTRLYLKPGLGKRPLNRLTVKDCQAFFNQRIAAGDGESKVRNMRTTLSAALTRAMKEELIQRNVARLVEFSFQNKDDDKDEPWTPEEVRRFLKAATGDQLYPAFVMVFYLGLRRGEALGVRWADVDWTAREIRIRKQSQRAGNSLHLSDVKTRAGRRPLPLLGVVRDALTDHQDLQDEWRDKAGDRWTESGLVITTRTGRQVEPRNFNRSFDRIRAAAGLRHLTPHGARHTCASLLGELRVEPRAAMEILGHSRSSVTLEIYQKASREARRRALKKVEKALRGD